MTKEIDPKLYKMLMLRFYKILRMWKASHQDACDIAQINIMKRFILNKHQTLKQTYVDFMRETYGSSRVYYKQIDDNRIIYDTALDYLLKKEATEINIGLMTSNEMVVIKNLLANKHQSVCGEEIGLSEMKVYRLLCNLYEKISANTMS